MSPDLTHWRPVQIHDHAAAAVRGCQHCMSQLNMCIPWAAPDVLALSRAAWLIAQLQCTLQIQAFSSHSRIAFSRYHRPAEHQIWASSCLCNVHQQLSAESIDVELWVSSLHVNMQQCASLPWLCPIEWFNCIFCRSWHSPGSE